MKSWVVIALISISVKDQFLFSLPKVTYFGIFGPGSFGMAEHRLIFFSRNIFWFITTFLLLRHFFVYEMKLYIIVFNNAVTI